MHTTNSSCSDTLLALHDNKTTRVFMPADGEASWLLLLNLVSLPSDGTVQPENTYSCILIGAGQVCKH